MYYVENIDKPKVIKKMLGTVKLKNNKVLVSVGTKIPGEAKSKWIAKRTHKVLEKTNSRKIVLSKELQKNEVYKNMLYSYGYNVVDGKWLFEALSCTILNYITERKKIKKEESQISVLVNYLTDYTLESIKNLSKEYKTLNIVTNHIEKLKKVQDNIYENSGLMITVTNNKKKSLMKSNIILNIDFPKELLNQYNIFDEAVIININGNMKIEKKRFNGLLINDYEITVKPEAIQNYVGTIEKYFIKELYEAEIYSRMPYKEFQKKISNDGLEIQKLHGINDIF